MALELDYDGNDERFQGDGLEEKMNLDAGRLRVHYPAAEGAYAWLPPVLDAYALMDAAMAAESVRAQRATGHGVACAKGCSHCCSQPIPVTPPEIMGISWYAHAMLRGESRAAVAASLEKAAAAGKERVPVCPFLVGGSCAVYPLRPLVCREYVVLRAPCLPGEDPTLSRPGDMVRLSAYAQRAAFGLLLPLTGETEADPARVQERMYALAMILQKLDWSPLLARLTRNG